MIYTFIIISYLYIVYVLFYTEQNTNNTTTKKKPTHTHTFFSNSRARDCNVSIGSPDLLRLDDTPRSCANASCHKTFFYIVHNTKRHIPRA